MRLGVSVYGGATIPLSPVIDRGYSVPYAMGGLGGAFYAGWRVARSGNESLSLFGQFSFTTLLFWNDIRLSAFTEFVLSDYFGVALGIAGGTNFGPDFGGGVFALPYVGLPLRIATYTSHTPGGGGRLHSASLTFEIQPDLSWGGDVRGWYYSIHALWGIGYAVH